MNLFLLFTLYRQNNMQNNPQILLYPLNYRFHFSRIHHCILYNLPKTKKFGCVGRGDLTSLFFSKVVKY